MPDLDIIERRLRREWRPVYRLIKGGQPMEEVRYAVIRTLAQILRDQGGLPQFQQVAEAVRLREVGRLSGRSLAEVMAGLEHDMTTAGGNLLARAALRPSVSDPAKALLQGPANVRLARRFLVEQLEYGLLSKQRNYLIGRRFFSRDEALRFENDLLSSLGSDLDRMAERLSRDPSAKSFRAPRRRVSRQRTTEELLNEPL